jgi:hypothetical protein
MHLLFPPTLGCEVLDSAHFDAHASFHPIAAVSCNPSLIRTHQSHLFGLGNSLLYSASGSQIHLSSRIVLAIT